MSPLDIADSIAESEEVLEEEDLVVLDNQEGKLSTSIITSGSTRCVFQRKLNRRLFLNSQSRSRSLLVLL